jgi:photosystem II stability/assembly factor-like uncharacterized protein
MTTLQKTILSIGLILNLTISVFAQTATWTTIGPSNINSAQNVVYDPNDLSFKKAWACGAGLWYCNDVTNPNEIWREANGTFDYSCFKEIVFNPQNPQIVYAISSSCYPYTYDNVVYKSINGGQNWSLAYRITTNSSYFKSIKVDNNSNIYLDNTGTLIKSSDGGTTWQTVFSTAIINDYEFKGNTVIIGTTNGKVYKLDNTVSTDISPNTTSTTGRVEIASFSMAENTSLYVLCRESSNGFRWGYKTVNNGVSWTSIALPANGVYDGSFHYGTYPFIFEVSPFNDKIIICGQSQLTTSTDWGQSWVGNYNVASNGELAINVAFNKNSSGSKLLIAKEDGIFSSSSWGTLNTVISISKLNNNLFTSNVDMVASANKSSKNNVFIGNYDNGLNRLQNKAATELDWHPCYWLKFDEDEHNNLLTFHDIYYKNKFTLRDSTGVIKKQIGLADTTPYSDIDFSYDYNSAKNILWAYAGFVTYSSSFYMTKVSNVGDEEISNTLTINTSNERFTTLRSGFDDSTFYWGSSIGFIYKTTYSDVTKKLVNVKLNPNNSFVTVINSIDVAPNNSIICSIFISGISDDLWFSPDGGGTWLNKHSNSLPLGEPLKVLFNPNNSNQVIVYTSKDIWVTDNILATNPLWYKLSGNLPKVPLGYLTFKKSTGELFVPTSSTANYFYNAGYSRGVFKTDYFSSSVSKRIALSNVPTRVCKGSNPILKLPFMEYGNFVKTVSFNLELSDANGSFNIPTVLQTVNESPFNINTVNLPLGIFKIRVKASDGFISGEENLIIDENTTAYPNFPRVTNVTQTSFVFQSKHSESTTLYYVVLAQGAAQPSKTQILAGTDAGGFAAPFKGTLAILKDTTQSILFSNLAPNSKYTIYYISKSGYCFTNTGKIDVNITNLPVNVNCIPKMSNNCYTMISSIIYYEPYNTIYAASCSGARYQYLNSSLSVNNYLNKPTVSQNIDIQYSTYLSTTTISSLRLWIDKNQNNIFEVSERINLSNVQKYVNTGTSAKYIKGNITLSDFPLSDNYYRARIIITDNSGSGNACDTLADASAMDFYLHVITYNGTDNPISISTNVSQLSVKALNTIEVISNKVGNFNTGNTFKVELSDSTGVFDNPVVLQLGITNLGIIYPIIPSSVLTGNHYRIRTVSTNPVVYSSPSAEFRIYNPCPNNINIVSPINQTQNFNTSNSIKANIVINSNRSVEFTSGNVIDLLPGFLAIPNAQNQFKASIAGCPY